MAIYKSIVSFVSKNHERTHAQHVDVYFNEKKLLPISYNY